MASAINAGLCALVATAFYSAFGYALARDALPRVLALGAAPVIGWAVFSAAALQILSVMGFSPLKVTGLIALGLLFTGLCLRRPALTSAPPIGINSWWFVAAMIAAAILAVAPALALLPKYSQSDVHLAAPIFDHSKIAIIDAMTRQGLPPVNPVFGEGGAAGHLVYYYLWHFSAAMLALPLRISGWEADIGLTWFTAFASLTLMMALAVWLSRHAAAAFLVVTLAASASLREVLFLFFGDYELEPFLQRPNGFAGLLFQSAWVPQHLMSASCTITAMLLLVFYARWRERTRTPAHNSSYVVILALVVTAGFQSSAFVGGVTFAIAALAAAPLLFFAIDEKRRVAAILGLALAGMLALGLAAPFIRDQFAFIAARGSSGAIGIHPFEVLGDTFPQALRRILDLPAYWLVLLPLEFPASFIAGVIAMIAMLGTRASIPEWTAARVLGVLAAAGLLVSWLLVSRLGDNNDLALRAILPAAMILIAFAAAGMLAAPQRLRTTIAAFAIGGLALSLPDAAIMVTGNWRGSAAADGAVFAQTPELWAAVRRHAPVGARVANNPLFLQDLTPWPANMSWALLADRSSCFAGRELAIPFAALSPERREAINDQFIRMFAGEARPGDVGELATKYGCDVVVVVPQDGAWNNDPFAASSDYRLVEPRDGRWRIYVRAR